MKELSIEELSIEEKARRYDAAIKYGQYLINECCKESTNGSFHRADLQKMFPELAEPDNNIIRKALIEGLREMKNSFHTISSIKIDDAIDWVEKQGKQKSLDDVAKEITKNKETAISFLKSCGIMNDNGELADEYKVDQNEQKPTKYEQKFNAGDKVLADGKIYTIKLVNEDNYIVDENGRDVQEHFSYTKDWKLYEQNPTDNVEPKFDVGDIISDNISKVEIVSIDKENKYYNVTNSEIENDAHICNWVIYFKDQEKWKLVKYKSYNKENKEHSQLKQEWSKEYEDISNKVESWLNTLCYCFKDSSPEYIPYIKDVISKLKSFKNRVQPQQKQEWSDEDEKNYRILQKIICDSGIRANLANKLSDWLEYWLESLKERYIWKPSERQISALEWQVKNTYEGSWQYIETKKLLEQLNRLM